MKKLAVVLMALLVVQVASAQFASPWNPDVMGSGQLRFIGTIDTTATIYSRQFTLRDYDGESFVTYPLSVGYSFSNADTCKITVYIQGSYDGNNWKNVDTLMSADTTRNVWTFASKTLNNKKLPVYRLMALGAAGSKGIATLTVIVYPYRKDH